jgi:hypothetical protein
MRKVSKKFGEKGSRVLFQTVVDNLKIKTTQQMKLFTDILDYLGRQNGKVHTV